MLFFCLLGHPPCSVFCVYIDSLGIHTLPTYIIQSLFSLSPCTPLSCTSPTAIMLPPSTVFTCEARTRQFPVSVYFFCLPAPFFFSLLSNTLLFCFFCRPPALFFSKEKKMSIFSGVREVFSLHVMLIGHAEPAPSTHQISTTHVAEKTYSCRI